MQEKTASPGAKLFRIFFLSYLAALFVLFIVSIVSFPKDSIFNVFRVRWYFLNTAGLLISFFIPLQCAVILLVHGLFPGYIEKSNGTFSSYVALFIILMVIYSLAFEILYPRIKNTQHRYEYLTRSGEELAQASEEAEKKGELELAVKYLEQYLRINYENRQLEQELDRLKKEYARQLRTREDVQEQLVELPPRGEGMSAAELAESAENYFEERDYQTAYYFASLAAELGSARGRQLLDEAQDKLMETIPEDELLRKQEQFRRKSEARSTLLYGDPVEAYYQFLLLSNDYPQDTEIDNYLGQSKDAISHIVFYLDEALEALTYPGYTDILFTYSSGERETSILLAERAIPLEGETYFHNMELMTFREGTRELIRHFTTPYVKSDGTTLYLYSIHRTERSIQYKPVSVGPVKTNPPYSMPVPAGLDRPALFTFKQEQFSEQSVGKLWTLAQVWPKHGYRQEPVLIEVLMRILYPFSFLIFSFFSLAVGIQTRMRKGGFTPGLLLLFPALPVVMYVIIESFYFVLRLLLALLFLWSGFIIACAVLFITQGGLLFLSIAHSAAKVREHLGTEI